MKKLTRLSRKAVQFCELGGYDPDKVRQLMNGTSFAIKKCETSEEIQAEGVSSAYPYCIYNPYGFDIKKNDE